MTVHIHPRREWRQPGKATGTVRCAVALPAIDYRLEQRFRLKPTQTLGVVTTFVRRHLRVAEEVRSGGQVTLGLEIRAANLGIRWKRILRWTPGDDLERLLRQASQRWADWPKEISHDHDDEDLEMGDAIARLRGGTPQKS